MDSPASPLSLRAIVFDFDGTLATTPLDFGHMHQRARDAMAGYIPVPEILEGPVLEDIERLCADREPELAARARAAAMRAIEEVEVETARKARLFPFVRPMLEALQSRNIAPAIISRNCPAAIFTVFPDAREHFRCVLTREDVEKVKPDPGHLLKALQIIGCGPETGLMVGDHPMDIRTGKRAGTLTAGVASGGTGMGALAGERPDYLAGDAGELMRNLGLMP